MALIDNMLLYYKLDSNCNDSTANGRNGTDTNNNISYSTNGKIGNCASFSGNSEISFPNNLGWTSNGTFSMSCWVKPTSYETNSFIIYLGNNSDYTHFQLLLSDSVVTYGKEKAFVGGAPSYSYSTSKTERTHFVQTITGSVAKLYINGVYVATGTNSGNGNTSEENGGWIDRYKSYTGSIDEYGVWNKVLSDGGVSIGQTAGGEVAELYNSGNGRTYPSTTNASFLLNFI